MRTNIHRIHRTTTPHYIARCACLHEQLGAEGGHVAGAGDEAALAFQRVAGIAEDILHKEHGTVPRGLGADLGAAVLGPAGRLFGSGTAQVRAGLQERRAFSANRQPSAGSNQQR